MRSGILILSLISACYAPKPQAGGACAPDGSCPTSLVCSPASNTCELASVDASVSTDGELADAMFDAMIDAPRIDGCSPSPEICGNGIDEDCDNMDPACASNDKPTAPIDVTAGGTFFGDALLATNDGDGPCAPNSGNDLFYEVDLANPEVYYFDTFTSTFDTVLGVYAGPCTGDGAGLACETVACGSQQSQVALSLPAGKSCIVVDQASNTATTGGVALHVVRGGRDGEELTPGTTQTGDTCTSTNIEDPVDVDCDSPGTDGKDLGYYVVTCPNEQPLLDADTCSAQTAYDSVLHVHPAGAAQIACNDDNCGDDAKITGVMLKDARLFWVIVDGFSADECGTFRLHSQLH